MKRKVHHSKNSVSPPPILHYLLPLMAKKKSLNTNKDGHWQLHFRPISKSQALTISHDHPLNSKNKILRFFLHLWPKIPFEIENNLTASFAACNHIHSGDCGKQSVELFSLSTFTPFPLRPSSLLKAFTSYHPLCIADNFPTHHWTSNFATELLSHRHRARRSFFPPPFDLSFGHHRQPLDPFQLFFPNFFCLR